MKTILFAFTIAALFMAIATAEPSHGTLVPSRHAITIKF